MGKGEWDDKFLSATASSWHPGPSWLKRLAKGGGILLSLPFTFLPLLLIVRRKTPQPKSWSNELNKEVKASFKIIFVDFTLCTPITLTFRSFHVHPLHLWPLKNIKKRIKCPIYVIYILIVAWSNYQHHCSFKYVKHLAQLIVRQSIAKESPHISKETELFESNRKTEEMLRWLKNTHREKIKYNLPIIQWKKSLELTLPSGECNSFIVRE